MKPARDERWTSADLAYVGLAVGSAPSCLSQDRCAATARSRSFLATAGLQCRVTNSLTARRVRGPSDRPPLGSGTMSSRWLGTANAWPDRRAILRPSKSDSADPGNSNSEEFRALPIRQQPRLDFANRDAERQELARARATHAARRSGAQSRFVIQVHKDDPSLSLGRLAVSLNLLAKVGLSVPPWIGPMGTSTSSMSRRSTTSSTIPSTAPKIIVGGLGTRLISQSGSTVPHAPAPFAE